jgi:hypothetical protein
MYNFIPQQGGKTPAPATPNLMEGNFFQRQYSELTDIRDFLKRPLQEPNKDTAQLISANSPNNQGSHALELVNEQQYYLDFQDDPEPDPLSKADLELIRELQPKHLGSEPLIETISGKRFYHDVRYPNNPISIDFARDPIKFQKEYPQLYPSYIIARKTAVPHDHIAFSST